MNLYDYHNKPETLHGHSERENVVPSMISQLMRSGKQLNKKQMDVVLHNPFLAFEYAVEVVKSRWPEGEDIIMTNKNTTDWYEAFLSEIGYNASWEDDEDKPRSNREYRFRRY